MLINSVCWCKEFAEILQGLAAGHGTVSVCPPLEILTSISMRRVLIWVFLSDNDVDNNRQYSDSTVPSFHRISNGFAGKLIANQMIAHI